MPTSAVVRLHGNSVASQQSGGIGCATAPRVTMTDDNAAILAGIDAMTTTMSVQDQQLLS